jgi:rRNA maturation protein Nop10
VGAGALSAASRCFGRYTVSDQCKHTPHPDGYLQHAAWAEEKLKTHRQERCPVCGLWAIWVPKKARAK